jgi:hypothetical protein
MKEPLTQCGPNFNFSGKSHNKHPQWYNEPLRLNKEQRLDPLQVFNEFFHCYHLNETRQICWEWLTEVVSSSRSISNESLDRCNHMFFYEKIEELIEAAFIITKRARKQLRKKEKRKFKRHSAEIVSCISKT